MSNLIIGGISGVGKSFLENLLEKEHGFVVNTKYTTRPYRSGEKDNLKIISLSDKEFDEMEQEFFPVIHQTGFRYGYKVSDIVNKEKRTIAVPVKDVLPHIQTLENALKPIILIVNINNLELLINRIKIRENFEKRTVAEQKIIMSNIDERMDIAKKEIQQVGNLEKEYEKFGGIVFEIKNDKTIFEEVVPCILKLKG